MSEAKITLYGLHKWMVDSEDDLWDNLNLPTGMDSSLFISRTLMRGAEFEVLYPDPDFMKSMIGIWSDAHYATFDRWVKTLAIEYNPLENYDRIEEWSDASGRTKSGNRSDATSFSEENKSASSSHDATSQFGTDTNEHTVSAYDSTGYQSDNKDKRDNEQNITNAGVSENSGSSVNQSSSSGSDYEEERNDSAHTGRVHGNVGVTSSQQLAMAEINEVARFNIYDEAADLFLQELCIYTY